MQGSVRLKAGVLSILLFFSTISFSQPIAIGFRVIGYVQPPRNIPIDVNKIPFANITHLNIAFVNPDSAGNLILPPAFDTIITEAHKYNIKVLASIGGGGKFNPYYTSLLSDTNRNSFVSKLIKLVKVYNLDGIDVDLEGDNIDKNYVYLITDLSKHLKRKNKLLTAAVSTWNAQTINTEALKKFDFINVMSYDETGPWRPNEPGPHSTYVKAEEDLQYWTNTRGFPKKKINLGLPFYGYCFGTTYAESMPYSNIINTFPEAAQQDTVTTPIGEIIHFNGLNTIKSKTELALKKAGGVMIWQLLQDCEGDKSLLTAINAIIKKGSAKK
jgi:GH18 family chitinase